MVEQNDFYPPAIKCAFFDLDETLIAEDSDINWARWRARRSPAGWKDLWGMRRINRLYYSGRLTSREYGRYHLSRASSMSPDRYPRLAEEFVNTKGKFLLYPQMLGILELGARSGVANVLITAQDEVLGGAFARYLGIRDCIASRYIIRQGKYTGMEEPLVYQEGKVYWAREYLKRVNGTFRECAFFSDSLNDLPLLDQCAFPVVVNPGKDLLAIAEKKHWRVLTPGLSE